MVMRCSLHDLFDCQRAPGADALREGGRAERGAARRAATATTQICCLDPVLQQSAPMGSRRTCRPWSSVSTISRQTCHAKRRSATLQGSTTHPAPSGALHARDVPTDRRSDKEVLRQPAMAATRQTFLNPAPPGGAPAQSRRRQTPPQKADGGTSMSETPIDAASRPIIEPGGLLSGAGAGASKFARAAPAAASVAAAKDFNGFGGGLAGGTRSCFEFNVSASQSFLDADDNDYEDLLGPVDPDPAPPPQQQAPPARSYGGGGASLLDGNFDEDESAASFQEALRAFVARRLHPRPRPSALQSQRAARHLRRSPSRAAAARCSRATLTKTRAPRPSRRRCGPFVARRPRPRPRASRVFSWRSRLLRRPPRSRRLRTRCTR